MGSIDKLLNRINDFYLNHGHYPKVRISMAFWEKYAHEIAELAKDNISIIVVDNIRGRNSFLLEDVAVREFEIDTLMNLKEKVDKWVDEGKGSWPVRCMATEGDTYIPFNCLLLYPEKLLWRAWIYLESLLVPLRVSIFW